MKNKLKYKFITKGKVVSFTQKYIWPLFRSRFLNASNTTRFDVSYENLIYRL